MRLLITLLVLTLVGSPALAKSKSKASPKPAAKSNRAFTGKLLSYQQLMKLPAAKRKAYLKGMVDLMITMESFTNNYAVADRNRIENMREQVARLLNQFEFLPQAEAREDEGLDDDFIDRSPDPKVDYGKVIPAYNGQVWTCAPGVKFEYAFGTCVVESAGGTKFSRSADRDGGGANAENLCPVGTQEIPHYIPGASACVPNASWARLNNSRREALKESMFLRPSVARKYSSDQQREMFLGSASPAVPATAGSRPADEDVPATPPPPADGATTPGQTAAGSTATPPAAAGNPETPAAPPAAQAAPPAPAPAAAGDQCEPPVKTCAANTDEMKKDAEKEFRNNTSSNVCVWGGFSSKYPGTKKQAGKCEPINSIEIAPNKTASPCQPDETMCNPVLFCIGSKKPAKPPQPGETAKPPEFSPVLFCAKKVLVDKSLAVTEQCAIKYQAMLDGSKPLISKKIEPKKRGESPRAFAARKKKAAEETAALNKGLQPQACDPKNLPAGVKVPAIWDKLVKDLESLHGTFCKEKNSKIMFCRECEIIDERVFEMTKAATGSGCGPVVAAQTPPPAAETPVSPAPVVDDGPVSTDR